MRILVLGSISTTPTSYDEALLLSLEHVRRSRSEPGCLSHAVHIDAEDPLRLVFVEWWEDRAALDAHLVVPASRGFAAALGSLVAAPPSLVVYDIP